MQRFVETLQSKYPNSKIAGGCSFSEVNKEGLPNYAAIINDNSFKNSAVGIAIEGVPMEIIQSTGCISPSTLVRVDDCDTNYFKQLDGKTGFHYQLEVIGDMMKKKLLNDTSNLLVGKLYDGVDRNDKAAVDDPLNYHILSLNTALSKQSDDNENDKVSAIMPNAEFAVVGDYIRYFVKYAESCKNSWKELVKNAKVSPRGQNMLMFVSQGRGKSMHERTSFETSLLRKQYDCKTSGLISSFEILNCTPSLYKKPYLSSANIVGIWFPISKDK